MRDFVDTHFVLICQPNPKAAHLSRLTIIIIISECFIIKSHFCVLAILFTTTQLINTIMISYFFLGFIFFQTLF